MDTLYEIPQFDSHVRVLEQGDSVSGGHGAPINLQATNIANRTLYLKRQLDNVPKYLRYTIGCEIDECGSVIDELIYLATTKEMLRRALVSLGFEVDERTPLREYLNILRRLLSYETTPLPPCAEANWPVRFGVDRLMWKPIYSLLHYVSEKLWESAFGYFKCGTSRLFPLEAGLKLKNFADILQFFSSYGES